MNRKEKILNFIKENKNTPFKFDELKTMLCVPDCDIEEFKSILDALLCERKLKLTKNKRYLFLNDFALYEGEFIGNERGYGFIRSDSFDDDIFVLAEDCATAMNKDKVLFSITEEAKDGKRRRGKVEKILARGNETVVGTFVKNKEYGFVVCDDKKMDRDIFIRRKKINKAKNGQKVVCRILSFGGGNKNPEGEITEIIGYPDVGDNDIVSVIKQYELPCEFSKRALSEADSIPDEVTEETITGRLDLRNELTVTIDGDDAKDLDDAISLTVKDGLFYLGVHIADVSYYVKKGSPLDIDAYKRGTSVYLVDRVIPMLPKKLSNGICSLNPGVDRLTLSVFMTIDETGKIIDSSFRETVINSNERMTYKNVTRILEGDEAEELNKYEYIKPMLKNMEKAALILRKKRKKRGSLDFNFPECSIVLDECNRPVEIKKYELGTANYIIEEFMLAANETVAEYVYWQNRPFLYRVHEEPDPEKMHKFMILVKNLGYTVKGRSSIHQQDLLKLLNECRGTGEEKIIETIMLRSLMKAKYSAENKGHFGLAAKYYCHFTSPIRRYPDLLIHRVLKMIINDRFDEKLLNEYTAFVSAAAEHCSKCEQTAEFAERDTDDIKKVEFMLDKIGEEYDGIISSVTGFGIFVELENTVEGLIRFKDLDDDYFEFDPLTYSAVGRGTGMKFQIGNRVRVRVAGAIPALKEVNFELIR